MMLLQSPAYAFIIPSVAIVNWEEKAKRIFMTRTRLNISQNFPHCLVVPPC